MTPTILFDLDDTLLENPMEQFLPAYMHLLGKHLSPYYPADKLPGLIFQATEKMISNLNPACTLENCFNQEFFKHVKHPPEDLSAPIIDFYQHVFPHLESTTKPIAGIQNLIQKLQQAGFSIAITTNPLFPKQAILHRLTWAGIPHDQFTYQIITAFEEFHFAKPHPEYIAETLAQIGWPDGAVMMIGNDWEADILPAEELGIPTYYLGDPSQNPAAQRHPFSASGEHSGLYPWIKQITETVQTFECIHTPQAYLAILRSTPAALDTILSNVSTAASKARPSAGEWSLVEILSHLYDVDKEVNIPRIKELKANPEPFFTAINTDDWADLKNYQANHLSTILPLFIQTRIALIDEILSLDAADWQKTISHTIFGPTSVLEIIKFMAQHDRIHIQQIHKTLAAS